MVRGYVAVSTAGQEDGWRSSSRVGGRAVSRGSAPAVIQLPIPSRISFRNLIRPVMDRDEYISTR